MDTQSHRMESMERQRGQIGLIVILIMTVILTIGASLAARSINDVSISRQGEEGNQTMQVAETGIEQVLSNLSSYTADSQTFSGETIGNIQTTLKVDRLRQIETRVDEGDAVTVDLTGASVVGNSVYIDWARDDNCSPGTKASLLVTVLNNAGGVVTERHYAYGGCATTNGFLTTGNTATTDGYTRRELVLNSGDTYVNIVVLGRDTALRIQGKGAFTLPYQSYAIRSTAANTEGNETTAVQVNRTIPAFPAVFNYVLYSGGTLVK